MVIHNEDMQKHGKSDESLENLDQDVARFDDVLTRLDEAMQRIAVGEKAKENLGMMRNKGRSFEEDYMKKQK